MARVALIEWDESLSVGVASLDTQHQRLVTIINRLHEALSLRRGRSALASTLIELSDYAVVHFTAEETLLKVYRYPELADQIARHQRFIERLGEFRNDIEDGALSTPVEMMSFLRDWLIRHIQKSDKKYSELLIENGVQ